MQTKAYKHPVRFVILVFLAVSAAACGGGGDPPDAGASDVSAAPAAVAGNGLTAVELEQGIGPIRDLDLGDVDGSLAAAGGEIFAVKCSACHKLGERYVGPDLSTVTGQRTPEYIMNMILGPEEMVARHPEAKKLFAEFNYTPMANQQLTEEDARAVLEYLRQVGAENPGAQN
ncbi:MAG: c-type cytochrome [Gemmatimonadota bacterium]|nr:c-type cytochrome [Gemmatimonadota bacterium]MDH3427781.1 c-type cytochrome [Gemmatimonadota bacterium]